MVGSSWQACPWMLDHGDSLRGGVSLREAPHICVGHIGGVLGISLELLTCSGYRDKLQTGVKKHLSLSGKVSKNSKNLPAWGHSELPMPCTHPQAWVHILLSPYLSLCFDSIQ